VFFDADIESESGPEVHIWSHFLQKTGSHPGSSQGRGFFRKAL
jgi:hypothetical protein